MAQPLCDQPVMSMNLPCRPSSGRAGFTLIEMMVVMLVLSLLLGAIVAIVRGTVQLTDEVSVAQANEARLHGLVQLCERTFRALPGHAIVRLRTTQTGNRYLTQLIFTSAPPLLASQGALNDVTVWETEETPDGYLRLQMHCMGMDEVIAWEEGNKSIGVKILMLENITSLEWRFLNDASGQWESVWNDQMLLSSLSTSTSRNLVERADTPRTAENSSSLGSEAGDAVVARPGLIELKLAQGTDEPQRWIFWVPAAGVPAMEP